jgi:hypothetical protein
MGSETVTSTRDADMPDRDLPDHGCSAPIADTLLERVKGIEPSS